MSAEKFNQKSSIGNCSNRLAADRGSADKRLMDKSKRDDQPLKRKGRRAQARKDIVLATPRFLDHADRKSSKSISSTKLLRPDGGQHHLSNGNCLEFLVNYSGSLRGEASSVTLWRAVQ